MGANLSIMEAVFVVLMALMVAVFCVGGLAVIINTSMVVYRDMIDTLGFKPWMALTLVITFHVLAAIMCLAGYAYKHQWL